MINSMILVQQNLITILLGDIEKIVNSSNNVDIKYSDAVIKILEDLKNSLELCNKNIDLLQDVKKEIQIDPEGTYDYSETLATVSKNTLTVVTFLHSLLDFTEFDFSDNSSTDIEKETNIENINLNENTLIISELSGKVILPYTKNDLENIKAKDIQKNYDKIIQENYTLPIDLFKIPFVARFREAFKLARFKEHKSIKFAFDLGTELLFNYNLHPAIISACRNLDELDIYLDYLENNETENFKCFSIIFEIPPTVS